MEETEISNEETPNLAASQEEKERRWEWLLLLLALLASFGCVFCSTRLALDFWEEWLSPASLLAKSRADYRLGARDELRFGVINPLTAAGVATDKAGLHMTPEGQGTAVTIARLPFTPTPGGNSRPPPSGPGGPGYTPTGPVPGTGTPGASPTGVPSTTGTPQTTLTPGPGTTTVTTTPAPGTMTNTPQPTITPGGPPLTVTPTSLPAGPATPTATSSGGGPGPNPTDPPATATQPPSGPTDTPVPPPPPTSTETPTLPPPTPTETSTPLPLTYQISGRVFEDANYSGGSGTAFGGADIGLSNVQVELYDGTATLIATTSTDLLGNYTFTGLADGTYTVRVVSASIGDGNPLPAGVVVEQTYEHNGLAGNGGTGAMGGNSPTVDDTTAGGPGDTNVALTVSGADLTGVDLGFADNVVVNVLDSGQGSLRQTLTNANILAGTDTVVFNIGSGVQTIQPASALPAISDPVVIDGTSQPGYSGSPIIEIDGTVAGGAGLNIIAGNSTVRGLVVNNFSASAGIHLNINGNNLIENNYLGLNVAGTTAQSNDRGLSIVDSSDNQVVNNVIAGNSDVQVHIWQGGSNTFEGNYIGTNAAGTAVVGNARGMYIYSPNNTIGGNTPAARNIISTGSGNIGIFLTGSLTAVGNIIQGNYIGTDVTGTLNLGNREGIHCGGQNTTIGGPTAGAGNLIAYSADAGVVIYPDTATGNTIRGNTIFDNGGLGIDLGWGAIEAGVTENDLGDTDTGPNNYFNFPMIDGAVLSGSDLTVTGFARPGSEIDFFIADPDPTGFGEGQTYLATRVEGSGDDTDGTTGSYFHLNAGQDATNRFRFTFPAGAATVGSELTATATDGSGNTSEFGLNFTVSPALFLITGRVFEDVDYSGGSGTAFGGPDVGLPNVTVELYDNTATLIGTTTTDGTGSYTFTGIPDGTYTVRVVSASIGDGNPLPAGVVVEQTYEHNGLAGNGGTGAMGGNSPTVDDTTAGGPGDTNVALTVSGADLTGVDLGFADNVVVNVLDNGQGSLRQTLTNVNILAGTDTVVFNIGSGVQTIQPASALPAISDPVVIDGATQPGYSGSPLIEIDGTSAGATASGLTVNAGSSTVRGLVINRFLGTGIYLATQDGNTIENNYLGLDAAGTAASGNRYGLVTNGSNNNQILNNVIAGNSHGHIYLTSSYNSILQGNYIGTNAAGTAVVGSATGIYGIYFQSSDNHIIGETTPALGNVISTGSNNRGIVIDGGSTGNIIQGNYIGTDETGTLNLGNEEGIYCSGGNTTIGGPTAGAGNLIAYSAGDGVFVVASGATGVNIQGNNIYANGGLGINLFDLSDPPDSVTPNDGPGDGDIGPNGLQNYPVLSSAFLDTSPDPDTLSITGMLTSTANITFTMDIFASSTGDPSGNGEGELYLSSRIFKTGSDGRFSFTYLFPVGPLPGNYITVTATDLNGNTSEFSPYVDATP